MGPISGQYGVASLPPPTPPAQIRTYLEGDNFPPVGPIVGRKWLFGGWGLEVTGRTPPDLPNLLNDLWLWSPGLDGWIPAALPFTSTTAPVTTSTANIIPDQTTDNIGGATPGARWGGVSWSDGSGNLWMFGGQGGSPSTNSIGFLNDIWKFTPGTYDINNTVPPVPPTYIGSYTYSGTWTARASGSTPGQPIRELMGRDRRRWIS